MKKYSFRAEKVLRVRRIQEDAARAEVAGAQRAESETIAMLGASLDRYTALATVSQAQTAAAFLGWQDRVSHRRDAVVQATYHRQTAAATTAEALESWRAAHSKVEGLERLDERRRDDYDIEVRHDEDAQVDEVVTGRARRSA